MPDKKPRKINKIDKGTDRNIVKTHNSVKIFTLYK